MSKFKVGDRVQVTIANCVPKIGLLGIVRFCDGADCIPYAVEFDCEFIEGHDCLGHCKDNRGRWMSETALKLVSNSVDTTLTIPYTGNKPEAHKRLEAEIAKLGGAREVKRAAKVGEYIKPAACNEFYESCGLTAGGVYLVHRVDSDGDAWVIPNIQNVCVGKGEGYSVSYVVLENYIPAEPAKPVGAKATPERIEKARRFAKLLLLDCFDREISVVFYVAESRKTIKADLSYGMPHKNKSATAKCAPEDEYNVWIGRAVALCKAVGRELPDWLVGKDD